MGRPSPRPDANLSMSAFIELGRSSIPCGESERSSRGTLPNSSPTTLARFIWTLTGSVHVVPPPLGAAASKRPPRYASTCPRDGRLSAWSDMLCMTIADEPSLS